MRRTIAVCLILLISFVYASVCFGYDDTYPHKNWCPSAGSYLPGDYNAPTVPCYAESSGFCQCNCTAYAAWKLKEQGLSFSNGFSGATWGNGGNWDNAAHDSNVNIGVDQTPFPGDVAYWNPTDSNSAGHVASVEKVYFNSSGQPTAVDISEYNYPSASNSNSLLKYGTRNISVSNPAGYIHVLLYKFGVMYYVDSLEMFSGGAWPDAKPFSSQTSTEAHYLLNQLYNYRSVTISGDDAARSLAYFGEPGMGGGNSSTSLPDFIIKKIWTSDSSGVAKTAFVPGEAMQIHIDVKNTGADTGSGIYVDYFRSNGFYKDSNPANVGTDFIHKDDLQGGQTHSELKNTTAPTTLGTYNMTAQADSGHDVDEIHENNNWSKEAVFSVATPGFGWLVPFMELLQ